MLNLNLFRSNYSRCGQYYCLLLRSFLYNHSAQSKVLRVSILSRYGFRFEENAGENPSSQGHNAMAAPIYFTAIGDILINYDYLRLAGFWLRSWSKSSTESIEDAWWMDGSITTSINVANATWRRHGFSLHCWNCGEENQTVLGCSVKGYL